jgi:hypothetical protein
MHLYHFSKIYSLFIKLKHNMKISHIIKNNSINTGFDKVKNQSNVMNLHINKNNTIIILLTESINCHLIFYIANLYPIPVLMNIFQLNEIL